VGVNGILAPAPAHHAVLVAVHAWVHEPLARVSQLLDVLLLHSESDRKEMEAVAARWRVGKVWRTTLEAGEALLLDRDVRATLRPPLRRLRHVEERTVLESHVSRALAPFWTLPFPAALRSAGVVVGQTIRRNPEERWRATAARIWRAFRDARMRRWEHDRKIGFRR
jgi:hypothetical protein